MHKFEQSAYAQIWEDASAVTTILQNSDLIKANFTFWRDEFSVDPFVTPTNEQGEAVFTSRMRKLESGSLFDMRAPLGDSIPEDTRGMEAYQGTIQEFISKGWVETSEMREYKRKMFAQIGDEELVRQFATNVLQPRLDGANQTLSHMAAQLASTGKIIYKQGQGLQGNVLKAKIPEENFLNGGALVWTNADAPIFDYMREIEEKVMTANGLVGVSFAWRVPRAFFENVMLKNNQVINWIKTSYLLESGQIAAGTANLSGLVVNEANFKKYITGIQGISPIKIIDEKQNDTVNGVVSGWKEGIVVFAPAGKMGLVRRTDIGDTKLFRDEYLNPAVRFVFSQALEGCAFSRNSVVPNGMLKEWHSDMVLAATPTLDEFLYHYIVDTTQANG